MMKKILLLTILIVSLMSVMPVFAEPTQQFSKIYLNPYYRPSLLANTNYTYNMMLNPPDGMTNIQSGIINFQIYISPTVNFRLWANGKDCGNYTISTTYATAGLGYISFECSSQLQLGNNVITLRSDKATSSTVGWADINYVNNPSAQVTGMTMHGTEYQTGVIAKSWLQLLDNSGIAVDNATCFLDIYKPDMTYLVNHAQMIHKNNGIYYYDITTPNLVGVYPSIAVCYFLSSNLTYIATNGSIITGTLVSGSYIDTNIQNAIYWKINEALVLTNYRLQFNTTFSSVIDPALVTDIVINWVGKWNGNPSDDIVIAIYNFTSGTYINLTNHIFPNGGTLFGVSNVISIVNLTQSGLMKDDKVHLLFRDTPLLVDTGKDQVQTDYLEVVLIGKLSPTWQVVRGSSEMHVTSNIDGGILTMSGLCKDATDIDPDISGCAYHAPDPEGLLPEGILIDNVTINVLSSQILDTHIDYLTPFSVDCTAIISINQQNGTSWIDITNDTNMATGTKENCDLEIPISTNGTLTSTLYQIIMDDYLTWEINWTYSKMLAYNTTVDYICNLTKNEFGLPNYQFDVPIVASTNMTDIPEVLFCHRAFDDLYYEFTFHDDFLTKNTAGEFESYLIESRLYLASLSRDVASLGNFLFNYLNKFMINDINNTVYHNSFILENINNTVNTINAKPICNLTYTNVTIENVTVQNVTNNFYDTQIHNYTNVYNYTQNVSINLGNTTLNVTTNFSAPTPKEIWQYFYGIQQSQFEAIAGNQQINPTGLVAFGGIAQAMESECINATSVLRFSYSHLCYGGDCFDVNNNRTETCQYGCNTKINDCNSDPSSGWVFAGIIIFIIFCLLIAGWRYL